MKLVPVDFLPAKRRRWHNLQKLIEDFANSDDKVVRVECDESDYKSAKVCVNCLHVAIKKSHRRVKASIRGENVYLSKPD